MSESAISCSGNIPVLGTLSTEEDMVRLREFGEADKKTAQP